MEDKKEENVEQLLEKLQRTTSELNRIKHFLSEKVEWISPAPINLAIC